MKKILCLIDSLGFGEGDNHKVFSGGAERQMAGIAGLLLEKGVDVTLATYHPHNCDDIVFERYGLKTRHIESGNKPYQKLLAVQKIIRKEKFDVVIAYKDGPCMIACLCKLMGSKFNLIVSERNTTQKLSVRERLKFCLYRLSDYIVPNSFTQSRFIKDHYPYLANKVNVITNFVDCNLFVPDKKNNLSDKIRVLVVGRINPQKNIERFIRVVQRLKKEGMPVSVDWYGGIHANTAQYARQVMQQYNDTEVFDILKFKGETSQIAHIYGKYDLFCLPSLFEGFPNVICEAMSSGLPILCSRVCDNPSIVDDGVNGFLFDPLNEDDMYLTFRKMIMMDRKDLLKIGVENRKKAEKSFSEEAFVNKYLLLINK